MNNEPMLLTTLDFINFWDSFTGIDPNPKTANPYDQTINPFAALFGIVILLEHPYVPITRHARANLLLVA